MAFGVTEMLLFVSPPHVSFCVTPGARVWRMQRSQVPVKAASWRKATTGVVSVAAG
jgi:hypothetical protein